MKHLLSVLLLSSLLLLFSCGAADSSIVGTWKITECIVDGETLEDLNDCFFYFYEDGSGKKVILDEEQFNFFYSYDGETCILYNLTYPDGEVEAGTYANITVRGDKMEISANEDGSEEQVMLKRQK